MYVGFIESHGETFGLDRSKSITQSIDDCRDVDLTIVCNWSKLVDENPFGNAFIYLQY